jgi:hypothetical protein
MAKIHPKGIVPQATGPVFTVNDPMKIQNGGGHKMHPKKPVQDTSLDDLRPNKTLFSFPVKNSTPKESKVMSTKKGLNPHDVHPSDHDFPGAPNMLKDSYEKGSKGKVNSYYEKAGSS